MNSVLRFALVACLATGLTSCPWLMDTTKVPEMTDGEFEHWKETAVDQTANLIEGFHEDGELSDIDLDKLIGYLDLAGRGDASALLASSDGEGAVAALLENVLGSLLYSLKVGRETPVTDRAMSTFAALASRLRDYRAARLPEGVPDE